MEEKKGNKKGVEVNIISIELKRNDDETKTIKQVRFNCDKGVITYKPKVFNEEYEDGFKNLIPAMATTKQLPKKILEMRDEIVKNGKVKVLVEYNWWETTADGQLVVYRFVNSDKIFDNWKIIKEEGQVDMKEEQVGF